VAFGSPGKNYIPRAALSVRNSACDSVRICLLIAALNALDVLAANIENAYLTAPNREKIWCWAGTEFGNDKGKPFIVVRALYGLKSAGASFEYYEYRVVYVDDLMAISINPEAIMKKFQTTFKFKKGKAVIPDTYLGAGLRLST
jgi:hypothetical protein